MKILVVMFLVSSHWCTSVSALPKYYMDEQCGGSLDLTDMGSIRLKLTSKHVFQPSMDCTLLITTSKYNEQFMLFFRKFDVEDGPADCQSNWLQVHDGSSMNASYVEGLTGNLCGRSISNAVWVTNGSNLFLYFHSGTQYQSRGFDMVITQFHTGKCNASEYSCGNGRCICDGLVCNGYNPCGDESDCIGVLAAAVIIGIVFGSLICCIGLTCLTIVCCARRRRRSKRGIYQPVIVTQTTGYGTGYNYTT